LNVQPLWFRIMLFPILGLPAGLFYVWEIQNGESQISLGTYAAIVLLIGPISSLIVGLLLAGGIFYLLKRLVFYLTHFERSIKAFATTKVKRRGGSILERLIKN